MAETSLSIDHKNHEVSIYTGNKRTFKSIMNRIPEEAMDRVETEISEDVGTYWITLPQEFVRAPKLFLLPTSTIKTKA